MKTKMNNKAILLFLSLLFIFAIKAHSQNSVPNIYGTWVLSTSKHSNVLPDTIHIAPSILGIKLTNGSKNKKDVTNPLSLIRNNSLLLIYETKNKWIDTCKIELLDKSKIKGFGIWRPTSGMFENAEEFKVQYAFLPEVCSNHQEGHIAKSPKEREELAKTKHCTGFHSL